MRTGTSRLTAPRAIALQAGLAGTRSRVDTYVDEEDAGGNESGNSLVGFSYERICKTAVRAFPLKTASKIIFLELSILGAAIIFKVH